MIYGEIYQKLNSTVSKEFPNVSTEIKENLVNSIIEGLKGYSLQSKKLLVGSTKRYYAIKDVDLNILESLFPLIPPALTAQLVSQNIVSAAVSSSIALIVALILLLFRFKKNHIVLDSTHGLVLLKITKHPGITRDELLNSLPEVVPSKNELSRMIEALKFARKKDGTQIALINEDSNKKLYANDI